MKRWCRRGPLLVVGVTILLVVVIAYLRGAIYPSDSRLKAEKYYINATNFLTKKHKLALESNKAIQACEKNVEVLLIVPSAVKNQEARMAVRESWITSMPSSWLLVFFLGATKDPIEQDQLKAEANNYRDIIQDSRFFDSYNNLTFKTLALLQWTQQFCVAAKFLLKIDDDMYLNIPNLHQLTICIDEARKNMYGHKRQSTLQHSKVNEYNVSERCSKWKPYELIHYFINANSQEYESYFFGGYLYDGVKVDRNKNSKWYLDYKLYSPAVLPPFLSGTAYMLSVNLVPHLLYEARYEPIIKLEDVYISGLLGSNRLKLKLSHVEGWSRFRPQWNSVCLYKDLVTVHGLSPSELLTMTQSVNNLDPKECNTVTVYIANFFNSIISSLFPRVT